MQLKKIILLVNTKKEVQQEWIKIVQVYLSDFNQPPFTQLKVQVANTDSHSDQTVLSSPAYSFLFDEEKHRTNSNGGMITL